MSASFMVFLGRIGRIGLFDQSNQLDLRMDQTDRADQSNPAV